MNTLLDEETPPFPTPPTIRHADGRVRNRFERFDLLDRIAQGLTDFAEVEAPVRRDMAPSIDWATLRRAAARIRHDPRKRIIFITFATLVLVFTVAIAVLLANGTLGSVYEAIWRWYPGRPWTHVMRDHPWIYALLAAALAAIPFLLAPRGRWGRAFLTYVIFLIGFLGGHVFW